MEAMCSGPTTSEGESNTVEEFETEEIVDRISDLPEDIIQMIFARLPIFQLPTYRLVSKAWNDSILDHASTSKVVPNTFLVCAMYHSSFFDGDADADSDAEWSFMEINCIDDSDGKHLKGMSKIDSFVFDSTRLDIRIVNCCNGLLCVSKKVDYCRKTQVGVLNPMTNEYVKLPENTNTNQIIYYYGLGFSPKTKQYKVARVSNQRLVEIFILGRSRNWSKIDSKSFLKHGCNDGVYYNGGIYWIAIDEKLRNVICRLDVEDEKLEAISLPRVGAYRGVTIGVFNNSFYATFCPYEYYEIELWMMRRSDEGGKALWRKEDFIYGIQENSIRYVQLIKAYEDGEILCLIDRVCLLLYNPKTRRKKIFNQRRLRSRTLWVYQIDSFSFDPLQKILMGDA